MRRKISVAEVLAAGIRLKPEEAIAIAQQLVRPGSSDAGSQPHPSHANPPFGPPTPENVFLETNGRVSCTTCDVTPAVSEVARFIEQLLPSNGVRIAGSLRYTLGRAQLEVEAPPFDSLDEFAEALARYERGDRAEHVCRVLDRARAALVGETVKSPAVDRRRLTSEIFELRRQLRESDERLYDQQRAIDTLVAVSAGPPAKRRRSGAVAAGLAIGLTLVGAGELMRSRPGAAPPVQAASIAPLSNDDAPMIRPAVVRQSADVEGIEQKSSAFGVTRRADASHASSRSTTASETARSEQARVSKPPRAGARAERTRQGGVLDRLRLGWLRGKITIRHDDL
jgi:hypothetical protein